MRSHCGILSLFLLLCSCSDDEPNRSGLVWKSIGLQGKTVNEIHLSNNNLYVATTSGLYVKPLAASGDFAALGFADKNVEAVEVFGEGDIIVSIHDKTGVEAPALYKTSDGGQTWQILHSDFGGASAEPVFDLAQHSEHPEILYASGYAVVAKSEDGGHHWEPIYGDWGGFATGISVVKVNPNTADEVWAGGQGPIENGFLLRSSNETDWDVWSDLVENPTVVKEITFSRNDAEQLFVGFEGALLKTKDRGAHWETLIDSEENRFYFGIGLREGDRARVYAGGWLKTPAPQPLILFVSENGGESWTGHRFGAESYGGIMDLQIRNEEDRDVIFLGLDKGGVYQVTVPL